MFKKVLIVLLASFLLLGCSKTKLGDTLPKGSASVNSEFKAYLDTLFVDFIDPSDFTMNLLIKDPEAMGISREPYQLTFSSQEDVKEWLAEVTIMLDELKDFKDSDLSNQQILDKYVLIEYLEDTLAMEPYYDYEYGSSVIGMSRSLMGSLPSYLESYTFRDKNDLDFYLNFLKTLPSSVEKYIDLEMDRQQRGTGFSEEELNDISRQYKEIGEHAQKEDYFLIGHFETLLEDLNFVDDKASVSKEHKNLINNELANAYLSVSEAFDKIEGKAAVGLVHREGGKEYYELLLSQSTGKKASVEAIEKLIDSKNMETLVYLQFLGEEKHNAMFERLNSESFGDFKDGSELLKFLEGKYAADYPKITIPNYELRQVDPSMAESSSPAFYFTPPVDYTSGDKQLIYINGDFNNNLYATYAHEGLPGHMYQFTYFSDLKDMHPVRNLITTSANAEGWANYTEKRAVEYISDSDYQKFYSAYQLLTEIAHIKADIGVNYHGWSKGEMSEYFETMFGQLDSEAIDEIYINFVTNPAVYPTYYLSSMYYEELRAKAQKELDDKFDVIEFHKAVLDGGSASFNILEKKVNQYIKDNK